MKAYLEYLELHGYFALPGEPKLAQAEFVALADEFRALAARHPTLDRAERARLAELKAVLHRDKP